MCYGGVAQSFASLAVLALTAACDGRGFKQDYVDGGTSKRGVPTYSSEAKDNTVFGQNGFDLLAPLRGERSATGGSAGIGVNSFLWRASLDTISFMPLSSADPFGGVIITDWYSPPETPTERFKMNVYILGRQLRADGIRVAVFRQARGNAGQWADASVQSDTPVNLENQILTRARQLRVATATAN
jgi:hypothetical protein